MYLPAGDPCTAGPSPAPPAVHHDGIPVAPKPVTCWTTTSCNPSARLTATGLDSGDRRLTSSRAEGGQGGGPSARDVEVERAPYPKPAPIQHVGVQHHRADVPVPQQLLHGPDVVARLQEVGSERRPSASSSPPARARGTAASRHPRQGLGRSSAPPGRGAWPLEARWGPRTRRRRHRRPRGTTTGGQRRVDMSWRQISRGQSGRAFPAVWGRTTSRSEVQTIEALMKTLGAAWCT